LDFEAEHRCDFFRFEQMSFLMLGMTEHYFLFVASYGKRGNGCPRCPDTKCGAALICEPELVSRPEMHGVRMDGI
jgi:hypothetical protein